MAGAIDRTAITLQLNKEVDAKCYPPVAEFLKLITEVMSGQAQGSFGDVIISNTVPEAEDVNKIWIDINGQRTSFIVKTFVNGKWRPWYFVPPNSYHFFPGNAPLPEGFKEIGRFKTSDVPVTGATTAGSLPIEIIIASWTGYSG